MNKLEGYLACIARTRTHTHAPPHIHISSTVHTVCNIQHVIHCKSHTNGDDSVNFPVAAERFLLLLHECCSIMHANAA